MTDDTNTRPTLDRKLRWVPIIRTKINPVAQRDLRQARVDHIAAEFDPEQIGTPTVNLRDGHFYVIDGQHRIEALKQMGWGDQQIQCWVYEGLSEEDEADRFLKLSDTLPIDAFSKFRIAVKAGREVECDIDRIVRANGLKVSRDKLDGSTQAVGTLRRIYSRSGASVLARTLRIARDSYGTPGLSAASLDGLGLLCQRYNGELDDAHAIARLSSVMGGVNGLLGQAERLRHSTGNDRAQCVAAAAVEIINRGKGGGKKLPSWWKS